MYYSIVYSYLLYGCPVWTLATLENINCITILQKKCVCIINYAPFNSHTNNLFAENNILKFKDIIQMEQIKLVFDFKCKKLPIELLTLFTLNSEVHKHFTRNAANEGLHIPKIYSSNFGEKSLRYTAAITWNKFIKYHKEINNIKSTGTLKKYLKHFFISGILFGLFTLKP